MIYAIRLLLLTLFVSETYGLIYYLNESEYNSMPPIYKLDDYNSCLQKPSDAYCSVDFHLVSDEPNELLHMIEKYSKHSVTRYNHSQLRHGLCVTKACQNVMQDKIEVSEVTLEGCLNQSLWESYKLKSSVEDFKCYKLSDSYINKDAGDIIVGLIVFTIILLNILGSLYDVCSKSEDKSILLIFSLKRNWKKLTSTPSSDQHVKRLECINGLRCILLCGVIAVHCLMLLQIAVENTHDVELVYHSLPHHLLINGSIMLQAHFVIAGYLLVLKIESQFETHGVKWLEFPKIIVFTYFRLTPVYLLTIAMVVTWSKYLGPGPLWELSCGVSISDCRSRWWLNVLLLNNYVYDTQCMIHGWHVAANMQLIFLGVTLCFLIKKTGFKKTILITFFIVSVAMLAGHIYIRDLDGLFIVSPREVHTIFKTYPTFNETHRMGHAHISSFVIGLALGYLVHSCKGREIDVRKYQKLKYIYWTVLPLIIASILSGAVFYRDAQRDPLYIRVLYATITKPTIGALTAILIAGILFKLENLYSKVFEWKYWNVPSKLAYCVYIVHFPLTRIYVGVQNSLLYFSTFNMIAFIVKITVVSLVAAVPLFLMVETPFTELMKYIGSRKVNKGNGLNSRFHEKSKHKDKRL